MDYTDFIVDRAQHMRPLEYDLSENHNVLVRYLHDMGVLDNVPVGTLGPAEILSASDALSAPLRSLVVGGNTIVQDDSLLPVRMEGVETVGFNLCPEVWQVGGLAWATGKETSYTDSRRTDFIPVLPSTNYYYKGTSAYGAIWYDADKNFIDSSSNVLNKVCTTPAGTRYVRLAGGSTIVDEQVCINISDPSRNGTYEPYWRSERAIPASTYFPDGMRSAGTVRDELTETAAITRVGEVTFDGSSDEAYITYQSEYGGFATRITGMGVTAADPRTQLSSNRLDVASARGNISSGVTNIIKVYSSPNDKDYLFICVDGITEVAALRTWLAANPLTVNYALATPTTTPIDPALELPNIVGPYFTLMSVLSSASVVAPILTAQYVRDINVVLNDLQDSIADIISG